MRTRLVPLALLALMASGLGVASANAHEFLASSTGKLSVKVLGTSVVATAAGNVECSGASLREGEVKTTKAASLLSTIEFEKCKGFGLAATVSLVKVRSTAEGSVSLLETVTVIGGGGTCVAQFPSAKNQNLGTVKFKNTNKGIEKLANISHITSTGAGSCAYIEESSGTFVGDALVNLIGGTLDWK